LKNKLPSDFLENLGNSPDSQVFGELVRFPGIWGIRQILRHLGNFPDSQAFEVFLKFSQIPCGISGWYFIEIWKFLE